MSDKDSVQYRPNSLDSEILYIDGPIDNEIRPCRPSLLPLIKAESEKLKRYLAMQEEQKAKDRATEKGQRP